MTPEALQTALLAAVEDACSGEPPVALAFSGGLDSSLVAHLAQRVGPVRAYTVGFPRSQDLAHAREASDLLGIPWTPLELDDPTLRGEIQALLRHAPGLEPVPLSFELPLWTVLRRSREAVVLAGQGADELFGGYARYRGMDAGALDRALRVDWARLEEETLPRERAMASRWGKELRLPYVDPRVVSAASAVPALGRLTPRRKEPLRRAAARLGLPEPLVRRPKKAAQYGSGIMPRLERLARAEGQRVGAFLDGLIPTA